MLVGSNGRDHRANIGVLRSLYERTHAYYLAIFSAAIVLAGSIVGAFIALLVQKGTTSGVITTFGTIAFIVLLISAVTFISRLNRLQRSYLDVIQVYNLLAQYF